VVLTYALAMITRERVLGRIADHLAARELGHPLRVAVDGVTAAGKTTLARELAAAVAGTPVIDLKPYVAAFDRPAGEPRAGWLDEVTLTEGVTPADLPAT